MGVKWGTQHNNLQAGYLVDTLVPQELYPLNPMISLEETLHPLIGRLAMVQDYLLVGQTPVGQGVKPTHPKHTPHPL